MNVSDAIRLRHSVRSFQDKPVEEDKLERVLEAARLAPSARNMQDWRFVVVRDPTVRRRLAGTARGKDWIAQAPVVIAACGIPIDYVMSCGHPSYLIDVSIAIDHMTLQAVEEGLGTCWIGAFDEPEARQVLGIPDKARIVQLLPLGYSAQVPPAARKPRKGLEEIVSHDRWD